MTANAKDKHLMAHMIPIYSITVPEAAAAEATEAVRSLQAPDIARNTSIPWVSKKNSQWRGEL
jgi:hypothetical protein